jgi:hypothetical protein
MSFSESDEYRIYDQQLIWYVGIHTDDEFLAPRPTPKVENHALSAVCDCFFNIFSATLHTWRPKDKYSPEDPLL